MARKVGIGIIGTGWWATENHIPVLQQFADVELAGVCGLGREALRETQDRFRIPFATEDYRELLVLQGLDGVVVSSPHHLHYEHAVAGLEQMLHVFCEKPMALSADHAREMAAVAERQSRHFVLAYGWNYTDLAAEAKRRVAAGEIGQIEHVQVHMASALRDLFSGAGAWFAENAFLQPQLETWSDPARGGGFSHGQFTHALGLLFWITELQPAEVFGFAACSRTGADLTQAIGCRFANGATGMMGGAATMPPGSPYQLDIRLFGTEGMLLLDIERPRLEIRRNDGRNWSMQTTHLPGAYACVEPLRTFVDLIQGKEVENRSPARVGVRAVEVLDAAFRSARSLKIEAIC
jgi:predicted dehydrogenase